MIKLREYAYISLKEKIYNLRYIKMGWKELKIKEMDVNPNDFPIYIFHLGKNYRAQEFFGAHEVAKNEFVFRVWAPHASSVRVASGKTISEELLRLL